MKENERKISTAPGCTEGREAPEITALFTDLPDVFCKSCDHYCGYNVCMRWSVIEDCVDYKDFKARMCKFLAAHNVAIVKIDDGCPNFVFMDDTVTGNDQK